MLLRVGSTAPIPSFVRIKLTIFIFLPISPSNTERSLADDEESRQLQFQLQNELRKELEKQRWLPPLCLLLLSRMIHLCVWWIVWKCTCSLTNEVGGIGSGFDVAADPSEPLYCTCQKVSYGEMVACDNPDVCLPSHSCCAPLNLTDVWWAPLIVPV
jgi:hypothetical protein